MNLFAKKIPPLLFSRDKHLQLPIHRRIGYISRKTLRWNRYTLQKPLGRNSEKWRDLFESEINIIIKWRIKLKGARITKMRLEKFLTEFERRKYENNFIVSEKKAPTMYRDGLNFIMWWPLLDFENYLHFSQRITFSDKPK